MKTTELYKEIKKVANDTTLENVFAYRINHDKRFYQIFLHSEPSDKVKAMCEKNGFSIKANIICVNEPSDKVKAMCEKTGLSIITENIICVNETGKMLTHNIWEVMPINAEDIEYASDEVMKNINENVIIASEQAMVDAGMVDCTPRKDYIALWSYELNTVWNEMQWTPIMRVFMEPLEEDIKDDEGRVIAAKSTHMIDCFFGAPVSGRLDSRNYLRNRGVVIAEL